MEKENWIKWLHLLLLVIYLTLFWLLSVYFLNWINAWKWEFHNNENWTWDVTTSGSDNRSNVITWWIFATGITIDIPDERSSDEKNYVKYKDSWNFASFSPREQNYMEWNYDEKTMLMTNYLTNNTFQFGLPNKVKNWYLYVRLKKPTDAWIFLYWYWSNVRWNKVSWNIDKTKTLIVGSNTEFLYKLNDIPYIRFYDKKSDTYNRLSQMKLWTNNNFIAWFVRDYDWSNKIEEMTIAWE